MSLLTDAMTACVMLNKVTADDGYGGEITTWTEGAHFDAAITLDTSIQARTAQAQGVNNLYTVTVDRNKSLDFHDVFKRLSDGKIFRITSDGADKHTPDSASFQVRQASAEEWIPIG